MKLNTYTMSRLRLSVAACSDDFGRSWRRLGQILTVGHKPSTPQFAGIGDMDVVRDWRMYCTVLHCAELYCSVLYCTVLY